MPPPNPQERLELLTYFAKKCKLYSDDDGSSGGAVFERLKASLREGMSGAEIENLCREASLQRIASSMMP